MGLFGAHAFSPDAFANASSIINGGGAVAGRETDEERLKKLLAQLRGGSDPYNVGPINVTPQNRGGGLMNYFGGQ